MLYKDQSFDYNDIVNTDYYLRFVRIKLWLVQLLAKILQ